MNGIDISSHQAGIDLTKVPCDFVIVKATENTGYTNPDFHRAMKQGLSCEKLMGAYHYAGGSDPVKEAKFFLNTVKDYLGKCILCLDWESAYNSAYGNNDADWCKKFLDYIQNETGIKGFLYISQSLSSKMKSVLAEYHSWIAQYPNYNKQYGYAKTPWKEGAYKCDIRQYTSQMYLNGYSSNLDADKCYMSREEWLDAQKIKDNKPESRQEVSLPELSRKLEASKLESVKAFQLLCNARFNSRLDVDGYYGPRSEEACIRAKEFYRLNVNGICDNDLWVSLILNK